MEKVFYTIMEDDKFLNSNFMRDMNDNISEAIRFDSLEDVKYYFKDLREDRNFRIVKVVCKLEDVEI